MSEIISTLNILRRFSGTWIGHGHASFPTIGRYKYRERLYFTEDPSRPFLFYEQRAEQRAEGELNYVPSHWESGFLFVTGPNTIQMTNTQDSGRLEILEMTLGLTGDRILLAGNSTGHFNDARMAGTARMYELTGNQLRYTMEMATTKVPDRTLHLSAELKKVGT